MFRAVLKTAFLSIAALVLWLSFIMGGQPDSS